MLPVQIGPFGPVPPGPGGPRMAGVRRTVEVSTAVRAPIGRATEVLVGEPGCVVAEGCTPEERRERRFSTTLGVDLGPGGHLDARVVVELGPARSDAERTTLPVRWRAAGWERMFPAFAGALEASRDGAGTTLVLRGTYTVPLGPLGGFGDGLAGRRVARRSLTAFLEQAARRLDAEVAHRYHAVSPEQSSYPVALRELGTSHPTG